MANYREQHYMKLKKTIKDRGIQLPTKCDVATLAALLEADDQQKQQDGKGHTEEETVYEEETAQEEAARQAGEGRNGSGEETEGGRHTVLPRAGHENVLPAAQQVYTVMPFGRRVWVFGASMFSPLILAYCASVLMRVLAHARSSGWVNRYWADDYVDGLKDTELWLMWFWRRNCLYCVVMWVLFVMLPEVAQMLGWHPRAVDFPVNNGPSATATAVPNDTFIHSTRAKSARDTDAMDQVATCQDISAGPYTTVRNTEVTVHPSLPCSSSPTQATPGHECSTPSSTTTAWSAEQHVRSSSGSQSALTGTVTLPDHCISGTEPSTAEFARLTQECKDRDDTITQLRQLLHSLSRSEAAARAATEELAEQLDQGCKNRDDTISDLQHQLRELSETASATKREAQRVEAEALTREADVRCSVVRLESRNRELEAIADEHKMTIQELRGANRVLSDALARGEEILSSLDRAQNHLASSEERYKRCKGRLLHTVSEYYQKIERLTQSAHGLNDTIASLERNMHAVTQSEVKAYHDGLALAAHALSEPRRKAICCLVMRSAKTAGEEQALPVQVNSSGLVTYRGSSEPGNRDSVSSSWYHYVFTDDRQDWNTWILATSIARAAVVGHTSAAFADGPSGAGKSHLFLEAPFSFIAQVISAITILQWHTPKLCGFGCKVLEVHNEKVYDLLDNGHPLEASSTNINAIWSAATYQPLDVGNPRECWEAIKDKILQHRTTGKMNANSRSSRGHVVYALQLKGRGSVYFIDLAGSEELVAVTNSEYGSPRPKDGKIVGTKEVREGTGIKTVRYEVQCALRALKDRGKFEAADFGSSMLIKLLKDTVFKSKSCNIAHMTFLHPSAQQQALNIAALQTGGMSGNQPSRADQSVQDITIADFSDTDHGRVWAALAKSGCHAWPDIHARPGSQD